MSKKRNTINIIDLFSGAGGLTEGFRQTPFNIVGHVEMDAAACQTLALRDAYYYLKDNHRLDLYRDFLTQHVSFTQLIAQIPEPILQKTLHAEISEQTMPILFAEFDKRLNNRHVDGIIGGPPCQAYSTIGRARNAGKKATDVRIYLYRYYIDFLVRYAPKFFVFENVKGLLSFKDVDGHRLFPKMQQEFRDQGYELDYRLIDTSEYGVPEKRQRVIIFGAKNQESINRFFKGLENTKQAAVTVAEVFEDLPKMQAGESANTYAKQANQFTQTHYRSADLPLTQNVSRPQTKNDLQIFKQVVLAKRQGINLRYDQLADNLKTHKNTTGFLDRYKSLSYDEPSHTITAHISKDGLHFIHPDIAQNRSITVREAARIQGFPDDYYFESSRTEAFKQIGNAVPPIFSEKIANDIKNS